MQPILDVGSRPKASRYGMQPILGVGSRPKASCLASRARTCASLRVSIVVLIVVLDPMLEA